MADALNHSRHLTTWFSPYDGDKAFGAIHDAFSHSFAGKNVYVNPPFNNIRTGENAISRVIKKAAQDIKRMP